MKKASFLILPLLGILFLSSCVKYVDQPDAIQSPNEKISLYFELDESGTPTYSVQLNAQDVIKKSSMGFDFLEAQDMTNGFVIMGFDELMMNENYELPWGNKEWSTIILMNSW